MDELYMQSVIQDRQKEVNKIVEYNRIHRHYRDSARSQVESAGQGKNVLSSWFWVVAKRLKGVLAINNKDGVKV